MSSANQSEPTKSELLFERFCREHGIEFKRIPRAQGKRTPDYEFYPGGKRIVVEVAQIDPNKDDRRYSAKATHGKVVGIGGIVGQRIRQKLTHKADQLKARSQGLVPAILLVYNNSGVRSYTSPEHVCAAMFGFDTIVVDVPDDPSKPNRVVDRKRGKGSRMTTVHNTSVSALAVLEEKTNGTLELEVYHNKGGFAANPIDPCVLRISGVEQYHLNKRILGQAERWIRFDDVQE